MYKVKWSIKGNGGSFYEKVHEAIVNEKVLIALISAPNIEVCNIKDLQQ